MVVLGIGCKDKDRNWKVSEETIEVIQVRDFGDSDPYISRGHGEKWFHSEYTLKVEPTELPGR